MQSGTKSRTPWDQIQETRNRIGQPDIFTRQSWNKSRDPGIEFRQPGAFSRPQWSQIQATRMWIQVARNLHQATMEQSPSKYEIFTRQAGTESWQPETFTRQPWNKVQRTTNLIQWCLFYPVLHNPVVWVSSHFGFGTDLAHCIITG